MTASIARSLQGVAIALGCWALLAVLHVVGVFTFTDLKLLDLHYRLRGQQPASDRLALVEIDDATIAEYGRWPLPRETYAVLIAALDGSGASTIGLDLLFIGEDEDNPEGDRLLAGLSSLQPNLVHAVAFVPEDPVLGGGAATAPDGEFLLYEHGLDFSGEWPTSAMRVSLPYDALLRSAHAFGHATVVVDPDGVVRRVPQFVRYGERVYPSLAFRVAAGARGDTEPPALEARPGRMIVHWPDGGTQLVPIDAQGATAINFAGDREAFHHRYSMIEALRWYRDGDTDRLREAFEGRLVLVGTTAVGEMATDIGPTPFSEATPLVFIHANSVNAMLEGRFLTHPPRWIVYLSLGVVAALLGWAFMTFALPAAIGLMAGSTLALAVAHFGLFVFRGFELPGTFVLALAPVAYLTTEAYRRVLIDRTTRKQRREMEVARTIQRKLLPTTPPDAPRYDVHGFNIPAQEVGGDYFDWTLLNGRHLAVCLGDVSGKGVAAALLMSHLRASFHAETRVAESPRAAVDAMHASLYRATEPGRFATFFLAVFPVDGGRMQYCNAGHNPALLIHKGQQTLIEATGLPLAMLEVTPYEEGTETFEPGDVLVLYSDGITEAQLKDDLYGDDRLQSLVPKLVAQGLTAKQIADGILADVRNFTHGNLDADDVTVVVVRRV